MSVAALITHATPEIASMLLYPMWVLLAGIGSAQPATGAPPSFQTVRVLLVTGGHDFDRGGFTQLWSSLPGVTVREVSHPEAHQWFDRQRARDYDVLVFYDMHQEITEEAKNNLIQVLRSGKGLLVLHHAMADYQNWDEWYRIAGGRFRLSETVSGSTRRPPSTWKDDVAFRVHIGSRNHPVVRDMTDFDLIDETYGDFDVMPGVTPLLTTQEPTSGPVLAWAHSYARARVVTIQSGHGPSAWGNESFRRILARALRWCARKRVTDP